MCDSESLRGVDKVTSVLEDQFHQKGNRMLQKK